MITRQKSDKLAHLVVHGRVCGRCTVLGAGGVNEVGQLIMRGDAVQREVNVYEVKLKAANLETAVLGTCTFISIVNGTMAWTARIKDGVSLWVKKSAGMISGEERGR